MFRRYRSVIFAVAGLVLAGASPPAKQEPTPTPDAKQEPAKPVPPVSDKYQPYADKYAEACYKAENHDSADLCAQWRAAIAAEKAADATTWANWISTAGALLSFVSIILVLVALGQTRKANRLTMKANARATTRAVTGAADQAKALKIADNQVLIARETANRQLRAYVKLTLKKGQVIGDVGKLIKIALTATNYGKTPAQNASFSYAIGINHRDWKWSGNLVAERMSGHSYVLHNGGDSMCEIASTFVLTDAVAVDIREGRAAVFARGTYYYDDVFGEGHVTQIALEIRDVEIELNRMRLAPTGNIAT